MEEPSTIRDVLSRPAYLRQLSQLEKRETAIDVLEIDPRRTSTSGWQQALTHEQLIERYGSDATPIRTSGPKSVLLFFLKYSGLHADTGKKYPTVRSADSSNNQKHELVASRATLEWLHSRFNVSSLFLESIAEFSELLKNGNASFSINDGSLASPRTDVTYNVISNERHCNMWRSERGAETFYVIVNCHISAWNHFSWLGNGSKGALLLRPFAVEAIVLDAAALRMRGKLQSNRNTLFKIIRRGTNEQNINDLNETFDSLHQLSGYWHLLHQELTDIQETLDFLLAHSIDGAMLGLNPGNDREYIQYQASRNRLWISWTGSYRARTQVRIDLFYNLAMQRDSRVNIGIAETSRKIAEDTRKDSSSMITIAALTMLFLPGTFVSAIFSMTFFNSVEDQDGQWALSVMPQWWYYLAATVPLTIIVFGTWIYWQWKREHGPIDAKILKLPMWKKPEIVTEKEG